MSTPALSRSGFVLAGGRSTRMGRDKALLPIDASGKTLVEQIAECVRDAAGSVILIGPPERYSFPGIPVVADAVQGFGPLGGIYTALSITKADWNLMVACDMPRLSAELLGCLLDAAEACGKDCLVPATGAGLQPLCAVYHRRVLPAVEYAIHHRLLAMRKFVRSLDACEWPVLDPAVFENVNTPQEWLSSQRLT